MPTAFRSPLGFSARGLSSPMLFLVATLAMLAHPTVAFGQAIFRITSSVGANVRAQPTTAAPVVVTLPRDAKVPFLERVGQWVKVEVVDRRGTTTAGYISSTLGLVEGIPVPAATTSGPTPSAESSTNRADGTSTPASAAPSPTVVGSPTAPESGNDSAAAAPPAPPLAVVPSTAATTETRIRVGVGFWTNGGDGENPRIGGGVARRLTDRMRLHATLTYVPVFEGSNLLFMSGDVVFPLRRRSFVDTSVTIAQHIGGGLSLIRHTRPPTFCFTRSCASESSTVLRPQFVYGAEFPVNPRVSVTADFNLFLFTTNGTLLSLSALGGVSICLPRTCGQ